MPVGRLVFPTKTNPSILVDLVALESPVVGLMCKPFADIDADVALESPIQSGPRLPDLSVVETPRTGKLASYCDGNTCTF